MTSVTSLVTEVAAVFSLFEEDQCPSCKMVKAVMYTDTTDIKHDSKTDVIFQTDWYECDHCGEVFSQRSAWPADGDFSDV